MRKNKFIILLILIPYFSFAQEEYSNIILSKPEETELYFHEYQPKLKIKADYTSLSAVENKYPEQLIQSVLSATDQEWVNFNTLGGSEEANVKSQAHFDKIKSLDKDKNYFELHHKLTFNVGDIQTAIIKFFIYQENSVPLSGAMVMQNIEGRWYKTSISSLSVLSIIVMRLKSEVLGGIILGNSEDENINTLREIVTTGSGIDLLKLEEEYASWYTPVKNDKKINLYMDPKAW